MEKTKELIDKLRGEMATRMEDSDIVEILEVLQETNEVIKEWERISDKQLGHLTINEKRIISLQQENERLKAALDDIKNVSTLDEYEGSNPKSLLKACYDIAENVVPRGF